MQNTINRKTDRCFLNKTIREYSASKFIPLTVILALLIIFYWYSESIYRCLFNDDEIDVKVETQNFASDYL